MGPPARLLSPLEAAASQISGARYVCSTCRRQFLTPRPQIVTHHARRHNSSNNPSFTDKLRRKLWGTKADETPPGLKDPYGAGSQLEDSGRENEDLETNEEKVQEKDSPAPVSNYVPATTGEGLQDASEWVTSYAPRINPDFVYPEPFLPKQKLVSRAKLLSALHQAMVELCILEVSNTGMKELCNIRHDDEHLALINRVKVRPSPESSSAAVIFPNAEVKMRLLAYFEKFDSEINKEKQKEQKMPVLETINEDETAAKLDSAGESNPHDFLSFPLEGDLNFKFHFFKRASQLTGFRIPDNEISSITNPSRLLKYMLENAKSKPHTVAGQLRVESQLASLPNVRVSAETMVDREKELGRWKLIEEELARRDLPIH